MALTDFQTLVDNLVRDDAGKLSTTDRDQAIRVAVARYSKDRPRPMVEDLTAPGGNLLSLPAGWEVSFSTLNSLEYPVGSVPPALIDTACWGMYNAPGGLQMMVQDSIPAGETVRAGYTVAHVVDLATDTIPEADREPVSSYAAAVLLDQLASLYSGDTDSTIHADSVNHQSKASEYSARARALRKRYFDDLGIDPKRNVAAGVVVNMSLPDSRGRDRLTHPRRFR